MSKNRKADIIRIGNLSGDKTQRIIVRRDLRAPGRIYMDAPRFSSLNVDEAIEIANRLADLIEGAEIHEA